jgi:hypothetical protein
MELSPYVDGVRHQLEVAAEAGGEEARELAARLAAPLDAALRLALLEALSAAASEITLELAPTSVEVRLRGRDPEFVTSGPPLGQAGYDESARTPPPPPATPAAPDADEGGTTRTTLRLPDHVKQRVEEAAGRQGLSVNSWLIRAVTDALESDRGARRPERRGPEDQRYTGWAR